MRYVCMDCFKIPKDPIKFNTFYICNKCYEKRRIIYKERLNKEKQ